MRRSVVAAAVAVPALVVAGLITVHLEHGDPPAAPAAPAVRAEPDTAHRLTGDVDGDGALDRVTLRTGGHLRVRLGGTTTTLSRTDPDLTGLVGLAGIGTDGSAIVALLRVPAYARFGVPAHEAVVIRLSDGRLREVGLPHGSPIADDPFGTFWIDEGHLDAAAFVDAGHARLPVWAWTFVLAGDHLRATRIGRMCWDRSIQDHPTACVDGHGFRGIRGPLPRLLPSVGRTIAAGHAFSDSVDGRRVTVRYISGGGRPMQTRARVHLTVTVGGRTIGYTTSRPAPTGITTRLLRGADGGIGIVFRQETGDGEDEAVYELRDGNLRPVRVSPALPLGDVFYLGFESIRTWQGPDGSLYSVLPVNEVSTPTRLVGRVWSWRLSHGRLTPRPVGMVCMPDLIGGAGTDRAPSYRRCEP